MKPGAPLGVILLAAALASAAASPEQELRWFLPGTALAEAPDPAAAKVAVLAQLAYLPVLERRGGWTEVRYHGQRGWVADAAPPTAPAPGGGRRPEEVELVRRVFGDGVSAGVLGPFRLYADPLAADLLAFLDGAAHHAEHAYEARFGIDLPARPGEALLLVAAGETLSRLASAPVSLPVGDPMGYAGPGMAIVFADDPLRWNLAGNLLHELTHMLSRRLGVSLPPWLDEGLARDLECLWLELPEEQGLGVRYGWADPTSGYPSCWWSLVQGRIDPFYRPVELPHPRELVSLDRRAFSEPATSATHAVASGLLVSYLLEGEDGSLAAGFRAFLADVRRRQPATGELLLRHLGRTWPELDAGFSRFLDARAERYARLFPPVQPAIVVQKGEEEEEERRPGSIPAPMIGGPVRIPELLYEYAWLVPGAVLRGAPDLSAGVVATVEPLSYLPIVERLPGWLAVQYLGRQGWIAEPEVTAASAQGKAPGRRWVSPSPDPEEVGLTKRLFGSREANRLGPFKLYTDLQDPRARSFFESAANHVEAAYQARFGIDITTKATEAVLLFAHHEDFRKLAATRPNLLISDPLGFAGRGTSILFVGDRPEWTVTDTLVHELTHVLNRRRFNEPPPPWLEEGLAEDLACIWAEDPNAPAPGLFGVRWGDERWQLIDCWSGFLALRQKPSSVRLRRPSELVELDRPAFYDGAARQANYFSSALFVSYLLEGEAGALAPAFRAFLDDVANERTATSKLLLKHLGRGWPELEAGFLDFVDAKAARYEKLLWPSAAAWNGQQK